jgi:pimeloyl-ACP methyl ester carboxylesterase
MDRRLFLLGIAALAATGAIATHRAFASDMARARARLRGRSTLVSTRFGALEYATAGAGPPILVVHGTGGGFDQGLTIATPLAALDYQLIAPSRFGYLRSDFPDDPSSENQADAFVDLLDVLGIERAPVIGVSAGALPALAFAIRHPDRCAALLPLVPASYAPGVTPHPPSPLAVTIYEHALRSDFMFWLGLKTAESAMIENLLATDIEVFRRATVEQQRQARQVLWDILPVSERVRGLINDARLTAVPAPMPLEHISAPTLTISLEDDRFGTLAAARHIAASVAGARLVSYPTGGHVWIGRGQELYAEIDAFLRAKS